MRILYLILLTFIFQSCATTSYSGRDFGTDKMKGRVKTMKVYVMRGYEADYERFKESGLLHNPEFTPKEDIRFDRKGRRVRTEVLDDRGLGMAVGKYTYDKKNRADYTITFNGDPMFYGTDFLRKGKSVESYSYREDGKLRLVTESIKIRREEVIKWVYRMKEGSLVLENYYVIKKDFITETAELYPDGGLQREVTKYVYDKKNRLDSITVITFDADDTPGKVGLKTTECEYLLFDRKGNWIKRMEISEKGKIKLVERVIEYHGRQRAYRNKP